MDANGIVFVLLVLTNPVRISLINAAFGPCSQDSMALPAVDKHSLVPFLRIAGVANGRGRIKLKPKSDATHPIVASPFFSRVQFRTILAVPDRRSLAWKRTTYPPAKTIELADVCHRYLVVIPSLP